MEFCRGGLVDDMGYIEKHNLLVNDVGSGVLDFFFRRVILRRVY